MTAVAFLALVAVGTLLRWLVSARLNSPAWPWGTLLVNVVGSFLAGVLVGAGATTIVLLGAGLLGSLTTFSTLSVELVSLPRRAAVVYGAATIVLGVSAALAGTLVG